MPEAAASVGWISLLPPLLAIALAVWTRHVVASLFFGLWLGVTMLHAWNPLRALTALVADFAFVQATDPWNLWVLVLMLCIGGFVRLIVRSGEAAAFAERLSRAVTTRVRAQLAVWLTGIAVFFSDSANPLILGPLYAPLFDRLKLSREKLAYLIDSTASPICILVPITSWAAYVLSLVGREVADLPVDATPMAAYLGSIPFQFYPLASLALVPLIGRFGLDFGPMAKAEARSEREADRPGAPAAPAPGPGPSPAASAAAGVGGVAALVVAAGIMLAVLLWSGGFPAAGFLAALSAGNSVSAVTWGFVGGAIVLAAVLLARGAMPLREVASSWVRGAVGMGEVLAILILAWSLGACCDALGTGAFVAGVVERAVSPLLVPALVFLVGAVISFATGSAWGCYAILMPIAVPLAVQTGAPLPVVLAAVLSGGIFGDHGSPISDTTILSSMGAGCEHVEHVRTQLPYAATAGVAALVGFLLAGTWATPWVLVPVLALLAALALALGAGRGRG